MNVLKNRILPTLLLDGDKLVKTVQFKNPKYLGDPVNAVKIFNDKEVDELILLDITATKQKREPNYDKIEQICSEAFMPFAYGGGITTIQQIDKLFRLGIEKVILNSVLNTNIGLVKTAAAKYGAQSIVGSVDIKKDLFGKYRVYTHGARQKVRMNYIAYLQEVIQSGIGELLINAIHKDGTYTNYDLELLQQIAKLADIPTVICGGAKDLSSFKQAFEAGASAVAAGSLFVYRGESKGILINYPSQLELTEKVFS